MCKHANYRERAQKFDSHTIIQVVKEHKKPAHCDVNLYQSKSLERWAKHAAYKTIIRQESRKRGLGS